jgi:hypothetical protein
MSKKIHVDNDEGGRIVAVFAEDGLMGIEWGEGARVIKSSGTAAREGVKPGHRLVCVKDGVDDDEQAVPSSFSMGELRTLILGLNRPCTLVFDSNGSYVSLPMHATTNQTSNQEYPMMVISLSRLRKIQHLEPHQTLLARGELTEYKPGMMVIFVSHEWVSHGHPDPEMQQFQVLLEVLGAKGLVAGNPRCVESEYLDALQNNGKCMKTSQWKSILGDPDKVFIWFDYISVPQAGGGPGWQEQQAAAISCIPFYVNTCNWFMVLVPPLDHVSKKGQTVELATWNRRGWCRMENTIKFLSQSSLPAIVVRSAKRVTFASNALALGYAVGTGDFSCCEMGHKIEVSPGNFIGEWLIAHDTSSIHILSCKQK